MSIQLHQIKAELQSMRGNPDYSIYLDGVRRFLRNWRRKSRYEIIELCNKIKQAIEESREAAYRLFGPKAVLFFDCLKTDQISWP